MSWLSHACRSRAMNIYLLFKTPISRPIPLLVTAKVFIVFFAVCLLPPNTLTVPARVVKWWEVKGWGESVSTTRVRKNTRSYVHYFLTLVLFTFSTCCILRCLVCIVVSCLVCIVIDVLCVLFLSYVYCYRCLVCIVVILCVFAVLCVYCCFYFRCRTAG